MDAVLFGRYFLEFALLYPGAYLCLAPLRDHLKAPKTTCWIAGGALTALCLGCAALCTIFELPSNVFLLPILIVSFRLLRWRTEGVTVGQTAFLFSVSAVMLAVCSLMAVVLNARAETGNQQEANLVSTALLALGLSAVLSVLFHFTAVRWSAWLLQEYHGEAFWQSAWPLPAIYAAFLIFCIPLDPSVVLLNRIMIIAVLAVSISLLGIFLLLYEMYRVAQEYTRNTQLDRENQLLGVESRRYMELREYMEQIRRLRHDFRQHLHVISGLTEAGQLDELKHSVQNASYEQKDPLLIYKFESFGLFSKMIIKVNRDVLAILNKAYIPVRDQNAEAVQRQQQERAKVDVNKLQASRMQAAAQAGQEERQKPMPLHAEKKAGRNDPCPCGSGKKYKNCHGKGL